MINKNRYVKQFQTLMLKDYTSTNIKVYFAIETAEEGYDPYEENTTATNLNPKTIRGYVHEASVEQRIYKQYGLTNTGTLEIMVNKKYYEWFKIANKIEIEGVPYKVMREGNSQGTPSNPKGTIITKRAFNMLKVVLMRDD